MSYINSINISNTDYLISGVSDIIVCGTSASTVAKTATAMDAFSLDSNLSFKIKFTNGNTASSPTLNLSDTGAKSLTTTTSDYTLVAGTVYDCYYNGTSYVLDNSVASLGNSVTSLGNTVTSLGNTVTSLNNTVTSLNNTVTSHIRNTSNPHSVTKAQVGLGNCNNTADANKAVASAGKLTTARTTYVTLGEASTTTTRDWSGTTTIPVSGILNVANGGTGATSLANITVGNSSKLDGKPVQSTSIGGSILETTNYWTYVTESKFTTDGGYIQYSNGLLIQWGRIGTEGTPTVAGDGNSETVSILIAYTSQSSFVSFVIGGKGDLWQSNDVGGIGVINTSNSSIKITASRTYYPYKWMTIGY